MKEKALVTGYLHILEAASHIHENVALRYIYTNSDQCKNTYVSSDCSFTNYTLHPVKATGKHYSHWFLRKS